MRKLLPFLFTGILSSCATDEPIPDAKIDSFVPQKIACGSSCPAGMNYSALTVCQDKHGESSDHTLGCANLVTSCYCMKPRPLPPAAP